MAAFDTPINDQKYVFDNVRITLETDWQNANKRSFSSFEI